MATKGIMNAILGVPINNKIYNYLLGTLENTQKQRKELISNANTITEATTSVFTQYTDAIHQIVQEMAPRINQLVEDVKVSGLLTSSFLSTLGVQIQNSPLIDEIREILTGEQSPDKLFARMQQILYLMILKDARDQVQDLNYSYLDIKNNTELIDNLADNENIKIAIKDMLSVYYDLICGKSPMVHYESSEMETKGNAGRTSNRLIAYAARKIENSEWNNQQNEYKRLADNHDYRVWFLQNVLNQADTDGVVNPENINHSFLNGISNDSLKDLKIIAVNAYKRNLNDDIQRIVVKYNRYIQYAIPATSNAGNFNKIRRDVINIWQYIQNEIIENDVHPQIVALKFILDQCVNVMDKINNATQVNPTISVSKIDINIVGENNITLTKNVPEIQVVVKAVADGSWKTISEGVLDRIYDEAPGLGEAAARRGEEEETLGGRRRQYRKTRKLKKRRRTGGIRPRQTYRRIKQRRTMRRRIRRRGPMRKTRR